MADTETALRKMRDICLSLPETVEKSSWGEPTFLVRGKIFASCGEKDGICRIVFQLQPEHASTLVSSDPRFETYPRVKNCVLIDAANVKRWDEVRALVQESYDLNAPKDRATRKVPAVSRSRRPSSR